MRSFSGLLILLLTANFAIAQTTYHKMGQKALIDGDFKAAVTHLEKALLKDSTDVSTLYMLGYSYYHSANYNEAVNTFGKVIALKPSENSAYYYRGKAQNIMANNTKGIANSDREKLLLASIRDFSKASSLGVAPRSPTLKRLFTATTTPGSAVYLHLPGASKKWRNFRSAIFARVISASEPRVWLRLLRDGHRGGRRGVCWRCRPSDARR